MNIFRYELTDKRSVCVGALLRTLWFAIGLLVVWLVFSPRPLVLQLTAVAALYLVIVAFTLDHWKLRHPSNSARTRYWVATLAVLAVTAAMAFYVFLFRK